MYFICSEMKGADQLWNNRSAGRGLSGFHICKKNRFAHDFANFELACYDSSNQGCNLLCLVVIFFSCFA